MVGVACETGVDGVFCRHRSTSGCLRLVTFIDIYHKVDAEETEQPRATYFITNYEDF